jgi:hypothetical protein
MSSTISLNEMCFTFDEREFSSDDLLRSDKRQRMSPICVIQEAKHCNPATAALEAALALDAIDDDASAFEYGGVDGSLALFSLNEYSLEDCTPCTPRGQYRSSVHAVHEVTRNMSRMTTCE